MRCALQLITVMVLAFGVDVPLFAQPIGSTPDEMRWDDSWSRLAGNPRAEEPYVVRIKVRPNDTTMPHTHPHAENVTVISGAIGFGFGTVFDRSKGRMLPAGSFLLIPPNTPHFAWTEAEGAVIQAHGIGPFP
jgi:quercetin dioxygenase-like cupin family protein